MPILHWIKVRSVFKSIYFPMHAKFRSLSIKKGDGAHALNGDSKHKNASNNITFPQEEELEISKPVLLSRTTSRISSSPVPSPGSAKVPTKNCQNLPQLNFHTTIYPTTSSEGSTPSTPSTPVSSPPKAPTILPKSTSLASTGPIFFSQSAARRKPDPIERKLKCTLEELCNGCSKKIKITRDAISSCGLLVKEEEILVINVKPGWKKGTKVTFEGKGDERPGTLPADIIFVIDEKTHPVFEREDDDLELGVQVPLIQALTGCTISVPLLGGGQMTLHIEDIIYPGYEKKIAGQGMPNSNQGGRRGDLRLKFLVEFPTDLSDEERSDLASILNECD